jgi:alpha-galactosidase
VLFLFAPHREAFEAALQWIGVTHGMRVNRGALTGWCSWYDKHSAITGAHMQAVCKALKDARDVVPHDVIQIDEGYQIYLGDWRTNTQFPDGWKPVVEVIKEAGATPGVWLAPIGVHDATGLIRQHPEWFQLYEDAFEGPFTFWGAGLVHYLDPTHPGAQQFIRQIIRNSLAEGFRYFKLDFNNTA